MPEQPQENPRVAVGELSPRRPRPFALRPDAEKLQALAGELGLLGLRKLRFEGEIRAEGRSDWRVDAELGATVTQACVVTLEPVTTRIDEAVTRRFLSDWPPAQEQGEEVEMPEDETIDPLGDVIDLEAVMTEALALALPPYPRKPEAALEGAEARAAPPGAAPLTDEDVKPFAGLSELKKKLEDGRD